MPSESLVTPQTASPSCCLGASNAEGLCSRGITEETSETACLQIKADGVTRLVVLPLYPQFSISTSASSLRLFEDMLQHDSELQVCFCPLTLKPDRLHPSLSSAIVTLISGLTMRHHRVQSEVLQDNASISSRRCGLSKHCICRV